jgi:hypothetical protein
MAGVRFVDGRALLAMAGKGPLANSILRNPQFQYLLDSPLKLTFLRSLPPHILFIASAFAVIESLPFLCLFWKTPEVRWLSFTALFLTQGSKTIVQNLGHGDGLIIFLIIMLVVLQREIALFFIMLVIALWHPQQSFFIGLSYLLATFCYSGKLEFRRIAGIVGALAVGAITFVIFRHALGFNYAGRETYFADTAAQTFWKDIVWAPLAAGPTLLWMFFLGNRIVKLRPVLWGWLAILVVVAVMTLDVTRVMTLIALPIVLVGARELKELPTPRRMIYAAAALAFVPTYSWDGVEFFIWKGLLADISRWRSSYYGG